MVVHLVYTGTRRCYDRKQEWRSAEGRKAHREQKQTKRNISGVVDSIILICFNVKSSTFLRGASLLSTRLRQARLPLVLIAACRTTLPSTTATRSKAPCHVLSPPDLL